MKKFFLLLLLLSAKFSLAQSADSLRCSGIFLTAEDYAANKLSYPVNCNSPHDKIKAGDFIARHYIIIKINGRKTKLKKDSIFGYRNCKQQNFRFSKNDNRTYRILENKSLIIYTADVRDYSPDGKTFVLIPAYFFSKTIDSGIFPLNVNNLEKAFPGNIKFHDLLEVEFAGGNPVSAYDPEHQMYKVNYLFLESLK